jgi:hypothetical protein
MSRHRTFAVLVATAGLSLGVTGCGEDSSDGGDGDGSGSSTKPVVVDITEKDGKVEPVGQVVKVSTGQEIELAVTSDSDDEIHVHSDPEHEFEVEAGAQEKTFEFTIDTPGTIEVESHGLEVTILKLQVS